MGRTRGKKSSSKNSNEDEVDNTPTEDSKAKKKKSKAPKSKRSILDSDDENEKPPKSERSILKPIDEEGDTSDGSSDNKDSEKPRSWKDKIRFLRKKSGEDDTGEENDDDSNDKSESNEDTAASVVEADAMSTAQQSFQTKTTQANRHTKTIEDCETEFHDAIRERDWEYLESLLKDYDPLLYKRPKKAPPTQGKKNLKLLKYLPDMSRFKKEDEVPETPISPLLALDSDGRSPLHLCCMERAPSKLLLRVLNCARDAAAVKDKDGSLPLHLAIQYRCKVTVIERLVRGYYQGSWSGDEKNRTPLTMATDVVTQVIEEENIQPTKTYWGFPATPEDSKWQEDQERIWKVAGFLVQNRFDRRKRLLTVEHNQILLALDKFAPPTVISNLLATGKKHLVKDEVAKKVLFLLISRQYPIHLIRWYSQVISVAFIKEQRDFSGCGVVAAHFRVGCIKPKTDDSKRQRDSFAVTMNRIAVAKMNKEDFLPTPQYLEWWEKLKFFINLWSTHFWEEGTVQGSDDVCRMDAYILHNALLNSDVPPLLIELLTKLFPESISINHPKSAVLPIHFACRQWQFLSYPPRRGEKVVKLEQVCLGLLKKDPSLTRKRHHNRLPLHHAIAVTKYWEFVKPLVTFDQKSLLVRDPVTWLRPFQMAALKAQETFDIEIVTRREFTAVVWNNMTDDEQDRQMRKLLYHYDLRQLDTIFELLRRAPLAVEKMTIVNEKKRLSSAGESGKPKKNPAQNLVSNNLANTMETKLARSLFRLGNVEGHFIGWCYELGSDNRWKTHRRNFAMVKEAIIDGFVPTGMDKWWRQLSFWLWNDCPWDNIPRRADYLLHCALSNPAVSPWIVELILECFPRSATLPLPDSDGCYPLHIACITETYIPLSFEFSNKRSAIEMVAKAYHDAILLKWNDQLPIHYATSMSKQWTEIRFLAEDEPVSLAIPDSENDFFPFQLMALQKPSSGTHARRLRRIAIVEVGQDSWEKSAPEEKSALLDRILQQEERETVGCVFELLKRNPMLVHVGIVESKTQANSRRITRFVGIHQNALDSSESSIGSSDFRR